MRRFLIFLKKLINVFYSKQDNKLGNDVLKEQVEQSPEEIDILDTADDIAANIEETVEIKEEIMETPKLDISTIIQHNFPPDQYKRAVTNKTQVTLHHTVSGKGVKGDIGWWLRDPKRIATHFIIDWEGIIHQNYSTRYWGYHLGCGDASLDASAIAIEIDSWGALMQDVNGAWRPVRWDKTKGKFSPSMHHKALGIERVHILDEPYRGFYGFEKYTDKAIESLRQLLVYCNEKYGIPIDYREDMWDLSSDALAGIPGVYSHTSYRKDKSDIYPYPKLIEMLKNPYKEVA